MLARVSPQLHMILYWACNKPKLLKPVKNKRRREKLRRRISSDRIFTERCRGTCRAATLTTMVTLSIGIRVTCKTRFPLTGTNVTLLYALLSAASSLLLHVSSWLAVATLVNLSSFYLQWLWTTVPLIEFDFRRIQLLCSLWCSDVRGHGEGRVRGHYECWYLFSGYWDDANQICICSSAQMYSFFF